MNSESESTQPGAATFLSPTETPSAPRPTSSLVGPELVLVEQTRAYVQETLRHAEGAHDLQHILRVWKNAKRIAATETADLLTVELAALLHDIADAKFHGGDEEIGPRTAGAFLASIGVDSAVSEHVQNIIRHMSFRSSLDGPSTFHSPELAIVQDADRLDAIGAIGIARAFAYGGFKGHEIYNPEIPPITQHTKESYKTSAAPSINHFYEKLLLLKEKISTKTGKQLAQQRHEFMLAYLKQFYREVT